MQLTIIPIGTGNTSVGQYVAAVINALEQEDIPFTLTDMGTIIEGNPQKLFEIAAKIHELPFSEEVHRVVTQIVLDDRRDKRVHLGDKIVSVEQHVFKK